MTQLLQIERNSEWNIPRRQNIDSSLLLARDLVDSQFVIHKFGRNASVGSSVSEDIWTSGGIYAWPTGSEPIRVQADGNEQDHATGSGARELFIEGLDDNFNIISENLITSGALASAPTSQSFRRVYRVHVESVGEYTGANSGTINIETTGSAVVLASAEQFLGQSQMTMYTIPAGKVGYLDAVTINIKGSQSADLIMFQRRNADSLSEFFSRRVVMALDGLAGPYNRDIQAYIRFTEKTDIWWNGISKAGSTAIDVNYDLIVVDGTSLEVEEHGD